MNRFFDILELWMRDFFKHPVENIRQANPIVPGKLYSNFGNICKAVKYNKTEKEFIAEATMMANLETSGESHKRSLSPDGIMEMVRTTGCNKEAIERLQEYINQSDLPAKCCFCDFHKRGIPCPIHNQLWNGATVCDSHRYIIIKPVSHVY